MAFSARSWYGENHPVEPTPALYLSSLGEPGEWVSQPRSPDAVQSPIHELIGPMSFVSAGGSPDLSTYYFAYGGTLLPGETARAAILGQVPQAGGLYAYRDGELAAVGVLPDGTRPTYGAVFIGTTEITSGNWKEERFSNQVSRDGRRAFFISPDPLTGDAAGELPQLYMRENLQRTVLISRDQTSGAPAAKGVSPFNGIAPNSSTPLWARPSPAGRFVTFRSPSSLTLDAPENQEIKSYIYDVDGDTLRYVPALDSNSKPIATGDDGNSVLFESGSEFKVWTPEGVSSLGHLTGPKNVTAVRQLAGGSTYLFAATLAAPGMPNPGVLQIFRYDVGADELICASCPGGGAAPTSNAMPGAIHGYAGGADRPLRGNNYASSDGSRIFFDTSDPLSPKDTNGLQDVYEWENGVTHLLSSGKGDRPSFFIDSGVSGDDVFFATTDSIDPTDVDGQYDVYDARVGGGFAVQVPPAPCSDGCQGEPSSPPSLGVPSSMGSSGGGDPKSRNRHRAARKTRLRVASPGAISGASGLLRVQVPSAGRLTASGAGLKFASTRARGGGSHSIPLKLAPSARRTLSEQGTYRMQVTVKFVPASGRPSTAVLRLRFEA